MGRRLPHLSPSRAELATRNETILMQLFISHSSKDRERVELVRKRIEEEGFSAHLAEYDLQPQ